MPKNVRIDDNTWKRLSFLKIHLGKRSLSEVIDFLLDHFDKNPPSFTIVTETLDFPGVEVKGKPPAFPKIPMALEKKPKEEDKKKEKEEETYDKLIEEGYRFQKEEIRETRGNCPFCGGIGNPVKALHSHGWIHRLLIKCMCGKKYIKYLGKENMIRVDEFEEKLKKKAPECELYPWEKFKEEVIVVRGISSAD